MVDGNASPTQAAASPVRAWRALLRSAAVVGVGLWIVAYTVPARTPYIERQLWLSAIYVIGCAFRSFFPVVYLKRLGFDQRWTSSIFIGRSFATVAELAFALQICTVLGLWGERADSTLVAHLGWVVFGCMAVAQLFCWYGVATLRYIGELIEESLWTAGFFVFFVATLVTAVRVDGWRDVGIVTALVSSGAFVGFMFFRNLPLFVRRVREGQATPRLGLAAGLIDMHRRRVVSQNWDDWAGEAAWLTPYFTLGVWLSIGMAYWR